MALGLDNFLYDVTIDGKTANFHFWDADDSTNIADVSVSDKEFDGNAESREAAEYAYGLVSKQLNDKRVERRKAIETDQLKKTADEAKVAKAAEAAFLSVSQDNSVTPVGTEKRDDGVIQNIYSSTVVSKDDKKK